MRRPASWAVTTWWRTASLTGALKRSSWRSTVPLEAPVRSKSVIDAIALRLSNQDEAVPPAGQAALDQQQVVLRVGAHDLDLLGRDSLVAHVAGHADAAVDA